MPPAGSRKWRNCYLAVVERLLEQCLVYMHVVYVWACVCAEEDKKYLEVPGLLVSCWTLRQNFGSDLREGACLPAQCACPAPAPDQRAYCTEYIQRTYLKVPANLPWD